MILFMFWFLMVSGIQVIFRSLKILTYKDFGNLESAKEVFMAWKSYSHWVQVNNKQIYSLISQKKNPTVKTWSEAEEREKIKERIGNFLEYIIFDFVQMNLKN